MDGIFNKYKSSPDVTMIEDNGVIAEMIIQVDSGSENLPQCNSHLKDNSGKRLISILKSNYSTSDLISCDAVNEVAEGEPVEKSNCTDVHPEVEDLDMNVTEDDDDDLTSDEITFVGEVISNVHKRNILGVSDSEKDLTTVLTSRDKNLINKCDAVERNNPVNTNFFRKNSSKPILRRLRDCPHINNVLDATNLTITAYIYNLLYMKPFKDATLRDDILNFSGFSFGRNSQDYLKRFSYLKRMQFSSLREIYTTLIYKSEVISKSEMVEEILNFLFDLRKETKSGDSLKKTKPNGNCVVDEEEEDVVILNCRTVRQSSSNEFNRVLQLGAKNCGNDSVKEPKKNCVENAEDLVILDCETTVSSSSKNNVSQNFIQQLETQKLGNDSVKERKKNCVENAEDLVILDCETTVSSSSLNNVSQNFTQQLETQKLGNDSVKERKKNCVENAEDLVILDCKTTVSSSSKNNVSQNFTQQLETQKLGNDSVKEPKKNCVENAEDLVILDCETTVSISSKNNVSQNIIQQLETQKVECNLTVQNPQQQIDETNLVARNNETKIPEYIDIGELPFISSRGSTLNNLVQDFALKERNVKMIKTEPEEHFVDDNTEVNLSQVADHGKNVRNPNQECTLAESNVNIKKEYDLLGNVKGKIEKVQETTKHEVLDLSMKDQLNKRIAQTKPIYDKVKHLKQEFPSLSAAHGPTCIPYKSVPLPHTVQLPVRMPENKSDLHSEIKIEPENPQKDSNVANLSPNSLVKKKIYVKPIGDTVKKIKLSEPLVEIQPDKNHNICKISSVDLKAPHLITSVPKKEIPSRDKDIPNNSSLQINIRKAMKNDSDNDDDCDEPLSALLGHPSDKVLRQQICEIVGKCDLKEITINSVIHKIFSIYPQFNLNYRKEFIKSSLRSLLYRLGENSALGIQNQLHQYSTIMQYYNSVCSGNRTNS